MFNRRNISPMILLFIALAVSAFMRHGFSSVHLADKLMILPGIIIGLSFHEFAHAYSSYKLGDPTPKLQGRLTLNPIAHIDLIGFISLLIIGFGWGKPVMIDPRYYKNRRRDEAIVAVAGVTMNFIVALVTALILKVLNATGFMYRSGEVGKTLFTILLYVIYINIVLMVFNLIPVPPLDGFNLVTQIFDLRRYNWYYTLMQYGNIFLLILIILGGTNFILTPAVGAIYNLMLKIIF